MGVVCRANGRGFIAHAVEYVDAESANCSTVCVCVSEEREGRE